MRQSLPPTFTRFRANARPVGSGSNCDVDRHSPLPFSQLWLPPRTTVLRRPGRHTRSISLELSDWTHVKYKLEPYGTALSISDKLMIHGSSTSTATTRQNISNGPKKSKSENHSPGLEFVAAACVFQPARDWLGPFVLAERCQMS
jgi:hypothetical protein